MCYLLSAPTPPYKENRLRILNNCNHFFVVCDNYVLLCFNPAQIKITAPSFVLRNYVIPVVDKFI